MRVVTIILLVLVSLSIKETTADAVRNNMATCMKVSPLLECPGGNGWYGPCHGRCLKFFEKHLNFNEAEATCKRENGHLVSVRTQKEFNEVLCVILMATQMETEIWVGATRQNNGRYAWLDGSKWQYTKWLPGQPDFAGKQEKCLQANWNRWGTWNDRRCWNTLPFVCVRNP